MIATETSSDTSLTADQAADRFESLLTGDGKQGDEANDNTDETDSEDAPETDPDQQQEPEEDPEEDAEEPQSFTVKIDGKEQTVSADELVKGYQRNADYTRKTQEVAELRKAAQGDLDAAKAERAHYKENLDKLSEMIRQASPQEPNWIQLANENPAEYIRQQALFAQHQQRQQSLEAERRQVAERAEAENERTAAENREAEKVKLFEAIPEWKDQKKLAADRTALESHLASIGFEPDALGTVEDHRLLVMARESMLYRKLMAARSTVKPVQQQSPKPATPGTPRARTSEAARDMQRFKQSSSVQDAAKVFERFV